MSSSAGLLCALLLGPLVISSRPVMSEPLPEVPRPSRLPIVLCHGLLGFDKIGIEGFAAIRYFRGIQEDLESVGCRVYVTRVSKSKDVSVRAAELKDQVLAIGEKVNLVAHSMGGLDARYFISRLGGADHVASLTTIATPHRGTAVASWGLQHLGRKLKLEAALQLIGVDTEAFHNLTPEYLEKEFNPATPDSPEVAYFSYGGAQDRLHIAPGLLPSHEILLRAEGPNDGLVSVESARWGDYLGTLDADHADQINWGPTFDARPVYRRIVALLAERGF
ncbi:MAG: hypothetical protein HYU36_02295 [Planctomycetes bacterium]|nr:hypothetical protein [Planctomycetota bacterium]